MISAVTNTGARTDILHARLRQPGPSSQCIARGLVADYLRDFGLRDPDAIAAESRRVVDQAERFLLQAEGLFVEGPGGVQSFGLRLCEVAIGITATDTERCFNEIVTPRERPFPGDPTVTAANGALAVSEAAAVANIFGNRVVPRGRPRHMPSQPRPRLLRLLRRGYWYQVSKTLVAWWHQTRVLEMTK